MSAVVQIFIMKNGALEGTEMVSGDRFVIGADASSAVVLEDPSVGPRHLGVFVHDGKLAIQDLGAPGGTTINGAPISGSRYVNPREDVVVGVYTLKFKLMPAKGATSGPVPMAVPAAAPAPVPVPIAAPGSTPARVDAAATVAARPDPPRQEAPRPRPEAPKVAPIHVGHMGDPLENTVPGPPPPPVTDPPLSLESDDRTIVDHAPPAPAPAPRAPAPSPRSPSPMAPSLSLQPSEEAALTFNFVDVDDDDHSDDDVEVPWSLVERLVRPPEGAAGKHPVVEIVHYRGENVVDHQVLREGERFVLGDAWSKAERLERGLQKPIPLVRLKKDGVAEIVAADGVTGKVLRQGVSAELPSAGAAPLVDGELCSMRIGQERVFVRFAGVPALLWTKEQLIEARAERRLTAVSAVIAIFFLAFFILMNWLYGYRSKSEDVIELGDDGFAEIVIKDLKFEEPEPKKKPPPPVKTTEPVPQKQPEPKTTPTAKSDPKTPQPPTPEPPKPGLAAALTNIPKVADSASSQNLNAALSNIKGVRVPGAQGGFKTSALTGKGPSSGVQIGGAAGGVATSGINSLIRKDGAAGALGGKGDRAVAGKVSTQPRLSQVKGQGQLSKDEIQRVINSHVGEIQYCYEKQLRANAGLSGRVVLEWVVTPAGSVSVVKVATSSLSSTEATRCMMDKVKRWKFPKPSGNGSVTIVYPFVFNTI